MRRGPVPEVRALHRGHSHDQEPRLLVRDAGPPTFSADGRQLLFVSKGALTLWTLAKGTAKPILDRKAYPTIAAPPAWQPR